MPSMKFATTLIQTSFESPLGRLILAASAGHLVGVWFDGQRHQPDTSHWPEKPDHPVLQRAKSQLHDYFAGHRKAFDLPLDFGQGTAFQQAVWHALQEIPCGTTSTYGALSAALGRPTAGRAVGGAVGRNPLSVVLPCHRVMGANGTLTGYAGGLARKTALLQLEGVL